MLIRLNETAHNAKSDLIKMHVVKIILSVFLTNT